MGWALFALIFLLCARNFYSSDADITLLRVDCIKELPHLGSLLTFRMGLLPHFLNPVSLRTVSDLVY